METPWDTLRTEAEEARTGHTIGKHSAEEEEEAKAAVIFRAARARRGPRLRSGRFRTVTTGRPGCYTRCSAEGV